MSLRHTSVLAAAAALLALPAASLAADAAACALLTPGLVAEKLGLMDLVAEPQPSNLGGATCGLKEAGKHVRTRATFQITSDKAQQYFHPELEQASGARVHGEGYEAVLLPPENGRGNSRFIVLKGKTFASLTLWSSHEYGAAQFQALFEAVLSKL